MVLQLMVAEYIYRCAGSCQMIFNAITLSLKFKTGKRVSRYGLISRDSDQF